MKKYHTLGEFLVDYRKHRGLTQIDFSAMIDVDVRTVIRWEKNESLIKAEKEKLLIENMGFPHQVIRNLNTEQPIPVYFDFKRWMYSLTLLSSMVRHSKDFIAEEEYHTTRIETIADDKDFEFISYIQKNQKNCSPIPLDVLKTAARLLPGLNLVIREQSGYHGGHVSIFPLKYEVYEKIRDQKMTENELTVSDLARFKDENPEVFYFYSIYSNSLDNSYYLINRMLSYFKKQAPEDYIFAGITFQKLKVQRFREMNMQIIWEKTLDAHPDLKATFISGNFNEFLSGSDQQ
ncbi:helix-turn-helix domain-containing protein [Maribellus sediminis]|uniref:helix-turn-helix domain-containing protein n=1 Tax=Maribellus sediminis TaxID=2696285 RepID=UPI0014301C25|nr:helix-turn-helix transcriptional regulator [Maribellus sediminis]